MTSRRIICRAYRNNAGRAQDVMDRRAPGTILSSSMAESDNPKPEDSAADILRRLEADLFPNGDIDKL